MRITVKLRGPRDRLRLIAQRLAAAGAHGMQDKCTDAVRAESPAGLAVAQAAFLTVDVTSPKGGGYTRGLRVLVSDATDLADRPHGSRFETHPERVDPAYGRTLTWGVDGLGRWRAPTYGRTGRGAWHTQKGEEVFFSSLRARTPAWETRIEAGLVELGREIEG